MLSRVKNPADVTGKGTGGPITLHPRGPSQEAPAVLWGPSWPKTETGAPQLGASIASGLEGEPTWFPPERTPPPPGHPSRDRAVRASHNPPHGPLWEEMKCPCYGIIDKK